LLKARPEILSIVDGSDHTSKELCDPEVLLDELQREAESVAGLPDQSE
jgi:hypothetical protein